MNVYRIIVGRCVRYIVAANHPTEALVTLRNLEAEMGDAEQHDEHHLEVSLVPETEARERRFPVDDGGPDRSWAEECAAQTEPTVIACSEWP